MKLFQKSASKFHALYDFGGVLSGLNFPVSCCEDGKYLEEGLVESICNVPHLRDVVIWKWAVPVSGKWLC